MSNGGRRMSAAPLDFDRLRREIDAEVRARRASGAYPPGFERELDAVFARYAPPAASDDIESVTDQAEEAAGAMKFQLSKEEMARLDEVSRKL